MAMANTNGGKTTGKKLTSDQAKLAKVVQRIGAIDKKPARAVAAGKKLADVKKTTDVAKKLKSMTPLNLDQKANAKAAAKAKVTPKSTEKMPTKAGVNAIKAALAKKGK